MWLLTTGTAALIATLLCRTLKNKYRLGLLSLMLWGATIMIAVDHIMGYEGGQFLEITTDGMVTSGTWLGIIMLVPVFLIWLVAIIVPRLKHTQTAHNQ
ncbi:MAG: hypothetical protein WC505_03715 [Patescibacteria group bacterium]